MVQDTRDAWPREGRLGEGAWELSVPRAMQSRDCTGLCDLKGSQNLFSPTTLAEDSLCPALDQSSWLVTTKTSHTLKVEHQKGVFK